MSARRPSAVALVALAAACHGGGTSILVRVSAPEPLATLSADVSAGSVKGTRQWTTPEMPATLVLLVNDDVSVDVDVTLAALDLSGAPLAQHAAVRSIPHRQVTLDLMLDGGDGTTAADAGADGAIDDAASDGGATDLRAPDMAMCNTSGVDVALTALDSVAQVSGSMAGGTSLSRVTAGSCPTTLNTSSSVNGVYYVVQNRTASAATLSSWAVCASGTNAAAFLAYYPGSTIPSTTTERQSCTGSVSEGASATGALSSPEANGNAWCGGLTKANGGGITVPACGRVVVFMQQWPGDPDPTTLKFELE